MADAITEGILQAVMYLAFGAMAITLLRILWIIFWRGILKMPTAQEKAWERMMSSKDTDPLIAAYEADLYFSKYDRPPSSVV